MKQTSRFCLASTGIRLQTPPHAAVAPGAMGFHPPESRTIRGHTDAIASQQSQSPFMSKTSNNPSIHDIERIIELDFARATEAAALNVFKWIGKGDKNG